MNLLSIDNLMKSYGDKTIFQDVTFNVEAGDKIGLIGVNGTGKSTLLKMIAGLETPDLGTVTTIGNVTIEYLPQNPQFAAASTVLEQVFSGSSPLMTVLREYEQALTTTAHDSTAIDQQQLIRLSGQMDALNAWQLESEAKTVLTKLGITDFAASVGTLSGGQRKRIALAGALIRPSDLLILDEPTNHIDHTTVEWLEQYLDKRKGALLMITHDRYFLDRTVTRILEIDRGKMYHYTGNYSNFLEIKAEREEQQQASEQKRQSLLRKELAWIRRGAKARTTKQKARIERFEKLNEKPVAGSNQKLDIAVGASRLGRQVIELENIEQGFGSGTLIANFSYTVLKHDRVGIVGPNGSGKSTLLNILAGKLLPNRGRVTIGQTVKIGYFRQENHEPDETLRVIDYIKEQAEVVTTADGQVISASQMLDRFLFPPGLQWTPLAKLSGGEKRRLYLLRILMGAPNVLLLDEPTNDLDIQTLAVLEDYLDHFPGAVISVSHDRYFLDRVVDKIFALEGKGMVGQYPGGYSDYLEVTKAAGGTEPDHAKNHKTNPRPKPIVTEQTRPLRFTFKEQREYEQIDAVIEGVEHELQEIQLKIDAAGSDFGALQELLPAQQQLECQLDELIERWTYLNELAEKINAASK